MSVIPEPIIPINSGLKAGKDKNPVTDVPNFADNHETVKKFYSRSKELYDFHKAQSLRIDLENRMDAIDKYCRSKVAPSKQDADKTPDITNWKPPQLNSAIEILTANQVEILFPRNEPIGKFVPLMNLDDQARPITAELMRRRNLQFEYSNEMDNRIPKFRNAIWRTNKYGDCVVEMGWLRQTYDVDVPVRKKSIGDIIADAVRSFIKGGKKQETESHSVLRIHDFKDFFCDMLLDDDTDIRGSLHNQQGFELRCRTPYSELRRKQKDGEYKNVEFVNTNQLYEGETPEQRLETRQANAGESSDASRRTGEFEMWERWMLAPINENGDWDEEGTAPRWFWGTFCGRCDEQNVGDEPLSKDTPATGVICLRLNPNPYPYDELPFTIIHAQLDDKGMMHKSYYDNSLSVLEEIQKVNNAYVYAKDMQAAAPFLIERGALYGDKKFDGGPTSVILVNPQQMNGIKRLDLNANTADNLQMIQYLERIFWEDIMLMPKGFRGKEMGSRTSATEAGAANAQAAKPFLARVKYLGYQLIGFCARKDAMYNAHFQPESLTKALTGTVDLSELKPSDIYGPLRYKLTCVDDYENNIMEKAEQDRFAQIHLPILAPIMGQRGLAEYGKWVMGKRSAPIERFFPAPCEGDAIANSSRENEMMLRGEWTMPSDNDDDDTHINTHQNFKSILQTQAGDPSIHPQTAGFIDAHIQFHQQKKQQKNSQMQQGVTQQQNNMQQASQGSGLGSGEAPATTEGQVGQDTLGAIGGSMA